MIKYQEHSLTCYNRKLVPLPLAYPEERLPELIRYLGALLSDIGRIDPEKGTGGKPLSPARRIHCIEC